MVGGAGVSHQPVVQGGVGGQFGVRRGDAFQQDVAVGAMLADFRAGADGLAHSLQVKGFLVVVVVQVGVFLGVGGFEAQFALP